MKKILALMMALCLLIPSVSIAAERNKALEKAIKKERTTKLKELKKGKWELFGSSRTLEVALLKHWDNLDKLGDDGKEEVGVASSFKSKNIGHQMAVNNAITNYAQKAGSTLKGRVVSDMQANGTEPGSEFDHFYAAYERLVEKEIKNEMEESFSIIRPNADGTYEMQTFFIVSENAASKARLRALEAAAAESEAAQRYASKISDFVRAGFDN